MVPNEKDELDPKIPRSCRSSSGKPRYPVDSVWTDMCAQIGIGGGVIILSVYVVSDRTLLFTLMQSEKLGGKWLIWLIGPPGRWQSVGFCEISEYTLFLLVILRGLVAFSLGWGA